MPFSPQTFATTLDQFLTRLTPFGFSGALLIAHHDEILVRKGYGLADRANNLPNTPETVFCLGSVTKQFTAAAIMKLAHMGKLDPHDPLSKHIGGIPEDKAGITIHHLLTHTAGLLNYTGPDYELADHEHVLQKTLETPLLFDPGTEYAYSNAGYSVLATLVETISKQPYEQFLYEHLLHPAGLAHTGYTRPDWRDQSLARWYTGPTDHGHALEKPYPSWNIMGNGEMLSTLDDMFRWHQTLLRPDLLTPAIQTQMFTPFLDNYGYGWRIEDTEIGKLVDHNGASDLGTSALFRRYLDAGLTLILFCNQSYGDLPMVLPLQDKIEQILGDEPITLPPEVDPVFPDRLQPLAGDYPLPTGGHIHASVQGHTLILDPEGQDAINLLAFPDQPADAHTTLNATHTRIFTEVLAGNMDALLEILHESEHRFAPVSRMIDNNLAEAQSYFGDLQRHKVIGTVPSSFREGTLDTIIAIHFERGTAGIVSITREGKNVGMAVLEIAQALRIPCIPSGDSQLVGYHLPLARVVKLEVIRDSSGRIMSVRT